jgi:hypothetical protein
VEKSSSIFCIFQRTAPKSNRLTGENSPYLVTLITTDFVSSYFIRTISEIKAKTRNALGRCHLHTYSSITLDRGVDRGEDDEKISLKGSLITLR